MKKLNISSQLLILFIGIFLVGTCSFLLISLVYVTSIADMELNSRLTTYVQLMDKENTIPADAYGFDDMEIGYKIYEENITITHNLSCFVSDEQLDKIMKDISTKKDSWDINSNSFLVSNTFKNENNEKIYYVCKVEDGIDNNYIIMFTNSAFTSSLVKRITTQMLSVFLLIILLACYIIFLWSYRTVKRLRNMQNHIINMPKNKYLIEYEDDGLDEIGELSRSIEQMRLEIGESEKSKQEMLQNLSHDFKTPIAVIKSYTEAIEDGMADENATKIIIAQAELLKKKVNRLLQYNSLEYLEKDKEFESIDMKELVLEIVQNYKFQTKLEFELDLDENVIFTGYRENWHTVIDNIIDNAKRYAKTKIMIVVKPHRLRIYNDGDPIDEQFLNSVFKPYEKGSKGEFGLGMSIVKKTVEFFGYDLQVVNEDVGVSFIITDSKK